MPCLGADDPVWRICSLKLLFCRASSVSILNTSFLQDFGWWDTFPGRQTLLDPNNTPWHRTNRPWRPMGHPWQRIVKHFGLLDFRCVPSLTQDMTKNISSQTGISFPFQTPSTRVGISISKHPCSTLYVYIYIYLLVISHSPIKSTRNRTCLAFPSYVSVVWFVWCEWWRSFVWGRGLRGALGIDEGRWKIHRKDGHSPVKVVFFF